MFNLFKKRSPSTISFTKGDLGQVFPHVRNASFPDQYAPVIAEFEERFGNSEGQWPVLCNLAGDLLITYALTTPTQCVTVSQAQMGCFGLPLQEFHEQALHNFYSYVSTKVAFKQMALTKPNVSDGSGDEIPLFSYLEVGEGMEASCLLLTPLWTAVAEKLRGELRILVPTRNHCLFCGADEPAFSTMRSFANSLFEEAGDQGLSKAVFSIRDESVVVVP